MRGKETMKRSSITASFAAICAALFLAGCDKEATLHSGLEERQANLVMAALLDAGISCRKDPGEEGTWNVFCSEAKFAQAVNLLERDPDLMKIAQGAGMTDKDLKIARTDRKLLEVCRANEWAKGRLAEAEQGKRTLTASVVYIAVNVLAIFFWEV